MGDLLLRIKSLTLAIVLLMATLSVSVAGTPLVFSLLEVDTPDQAAVDFLRLGGYDLIGHGKTAKTQIVASEQDIERLNAQGVSYRVVHADLTAHYQTRLHQPASRSLTIGEGSMGGYFLHDEIVAFVDSLRSEYPDLISQNVVLGQTHDGFDLTAFKVSDNPNIEEDEAEVLFIGMHHAREPMSIVAVLYFTQWLVGNYETDPMARYIVDERQIWVIPILNIDGYRYNSENSPQGGGMWRKNKRDNNGDGVFNPSVDGVDLNRNYSVGWAFNDIGSSPTPGSQVYRGPFAFSEPETQGVRQLCNAHEIRVALNFHTFGDMLFFPQYYNSMQTPDHQTFMEYSLDMIRDSQYYYTIGGINGCSDDWMYAEQTEKPKILAYTPEIGDDTDGFWAPTDRILTLAQENLYTQQYAALVSGVYLKITGSDYDDTAGGDGDFSAEAGETVELSFSIRNKGYLAAAENVTATLISDDPMVTVLSGVWTMDQIDPLTDAQALFSVEISEDAPSGYVATVRVAFTDANGYDLDHSYEIPLGSPIILFLDDAENGVENWDTGTLWGQTLQDRVSGQYSFTDSPYSAYPSNWEDALTLANPIDLGDMNNAALIFNTKWNMQDDWDIAQLQVSTDTGGSWHPVGSTHTTGGTGTALQPYGEPVYNGFRPFVWLEELAFLSDFVGEEILFRYYLASDDETESDGWYVDDILLLGFSDQPLQPRILSSTRLMDTDFLGPYPVTVMATDAQGIAEARIHYSMDGENFDSVEMDRQDEVFFDGYLPMVEYITVVNYYVEVTDEEGHTVSDPPGAPDETYQFLVTNEVQDIFVAVNEINLTAVQGETASEFFLVQNTGNLPLILRCTDEPIDQVRGGPGHPISTPEFSPEMFPISEDINIPEMLRQTREILSRADISDAQMILADDDPPEIQDMQLIISDEGGDVPSGTPDIIGLYAELAANRVTFTFVFEEPVNPIAALGIVSLDTDQNNETGSYPPGLGGSYLPHDIGSEYELLWDVSNVNGFGSSVLILDNLGQSLLGVAQITMQDNQMSASIPLSSIGNDDGQMDVTALFLPGQNAQSIDFAPTFGHGTFGQGADVAWLVEVPLTATVQPNDWFAIEVRAITNLLESGIHSANILIQSNDPDEPVVQIPFSLTVNPNAIHDPNTQELPDQFGMAQNNPNPFQRQTEIRFQLPKQSHVTIGIYNIAGQRVKRLVNDRLESGNHLIMWDGVSDRGDLAQSGVYFYRIEADNFRQTKRMALIR